MEITQYDQLVSSETEALQSKMTRAIDAAMETIQRKQSELLANIKKDPRKSAIPRKNIRLVLQISNEQDCDRNGSDMSVTSSITISRRSGKTPIKKGRHF